MSTLRLPDKEYALLCKSILQRDGYRCRSCNFRGNLMVHHIIFRSHQGEDTTENLVTLCASCHRGCHEEQGIVVLGTDANAELKFLRRNGWRPQ
jgi:5-methylcytosine-specific restriction endonuclease McrA